MHSTRLVSSPYSQGPDSFFFAGTSEKISEDGTILPYPFEGEFYAYGDRNATILKNEVEIGGRKIALPFGKKKELRDGEPIIVSIDVEDFL